MLRRPRPLTTVASCFLVTVAGCSGGGASIGYESPEAAFEGIRTAIVAEDYRTALASVTDETQNTFTAGLVMVGSMMKAFGGMAAAMGGDDPEAQKAQQMVASLGEVMAKHGVTDERLESVMGDSGGMMGMMQQGEAPAQETLDKVASIVEDRPAFILEMVNAFSQFGDGPGPNPQEVVDAFAKAKLVEVKVDGDSATGTIQVEGKPSQPVAFRKTDAGWKLHLDLQQIQSTQPADDEMEMELSEEELGGVMGGFPEGDVDETEGALEFEEDATEELEVEEAPAE